MASTLTIPITPEASVPAPPPGEVRIFVDTDSIFKTKDSANFVRPSSPQVATDLALTGIPNAIAVDTGAAPTALGDVLAATTIGGTPEAQFVNPRTAKVANTTLQTAPVVGPNPGYAASIGEMVKVNIGGGTGIVEVDLPSSAGNLNEEVWIKVTSLAVFVCNINPAGAQTIDGVAGPAAIVLNTDHEWVGLQSIGPTGWIQIG
jgi:hypothetical protein